MIKSFSSILAIPAIFLAWIAAYIILGFPLEFPMMILLGIAKVVLALLPFVVLSYFILKHLQLPSFFTTSTSLILTSIASSLLGNTGALTPMALIGTWLFLACICFFLILKAPLPLKDLQQWAKQHREINGSSILLILICLILISAGWNSGHNGGIVFPQLLTDTNLYHLSGPTLFAQEGEFFNAWWLRAQFISNFVHHIFTFGIALINSVGFRGELFPSFLSTVLLIDLCFVVTRWTSSVALGLVALFFILLPDAVRASINSAYLDLPAAYFCTMSLIACLDFCTNKNPRMLIAIAALCSSAFCAKYFSVFFLLPILAIPFLSLLRMRDGYKKAIVFSLVGIATFAVILLSSNFHNIRFSDQILFPFVGSFDESNKYFWRKEDYLEFGSAIDRFQNHSISTFAVSPFSLAAKPENLLHDGLEFNFGYGLLILYLMFIGFLPIWIRQQQRPILHAAVLVSILLVQLVLWFLKSPNTRYFYPGYFTLIIFVIFIARGIKFPPKYTSLISTLSGCIILLLVGLTLGKSKVKTLAPTHKSYSELKTEWRSGKDDIFEPIHWLSRNSSDTSVVFNLFADHAFLYLNRPILGDWFGHSSYSGFLSKGFEETAKFFSERGTEFILLNKQSDVFKIWFNTNEKLFGSYASCLSIVFESNTYRIYQVKNVPTCRPSSERPEIADLKKKRRKSFL